MPVRKHSDMWRAKHIQHTLGLFVAVRFMERRGYSKDLRRIILLGANHL